MCFPVAGHLPASKTHANRRWTFVPATSDAQPGLGVLTIVQGRDCDSYGIEVEGGQVLFAKLDEAADVYGVECNRLGLPVACNCKGFAFKKTCKHVDAAREMKADGLI